MRLTLLKPNNLLAAFLHRFVAALTVFIAAILLFKMTNCQRSIRLPLRQLTAAALVAVSFPECEAGEAALCGSVGASKGLAILP